MQGFLNRISIIIGVLALALNQWIEGFFGGVGYGASALCNYLYPVTNGFWLSHADPYISITNFQIFISYCLVTFLALTLFEKGWITNLLGFAPISLCLIFWLQIDRIRKVDLSSADKYVEPLRQTNSFVWALLAFIILLMLLQIVAVVVKLGKKRIESGKLT